MGSSRQTPPYSPVTSRQNTTGGVLFWTDPLAPELRVQPVARMILDHAPRNIAAVVRTAYLALLRLCALFCLLSGLAAADLPEIVERVKPSVVVVGTYQLSRSPQFVMRGTGFVVGDGRQIATNAHVVEQSVDVVAGEKLTILTRLAATGAQQRPAQIVAIDKTHDLAVLRIEGQPLPALHLHVAELAREGQSVAFTGFPIGGALGFYSPVTHRGIVSAITPIVLPGGNAREINARVVNQMRSGSFDIYQLDATAYPGNSGGPLYEIDNGEVIGIINMVLVKETRESILSKPSAISYAIPVRFLRELVSKASP